MKLLKPTLVAKILPDQARPELPHLCADAGYVGEEARRQMLESGYVPHVRGRTEEAQEKTQQLHKPKRWVVERTHSWLNRYRKLLVSFEKTERAYLGLLYFACAITAWRRTLFIYG